MKNTPTMKNKVMKTENITKAAHSVCFTVLALQDALRDAINSGNQFACLVLEQALADATALQFKITRINDAVDNQK